ncbi:DNA polymerase III subunit beta [Paracoccus aminophilus]|uniref:Beta sliding clamp n=1 Tax=Paracoccus aminophilus JCM 7686 TaxID=1367847 RepID=S5Y0T8_PARAH|nr:DNA polymerase III subunit beta [Paracoccus aminophilus]AGT09335.1 DNA polymerase III, subunit beta [Paracoccus aminophilus JCM 7686]
MNAFSEVIAEAAPAASATTIRCTVADLRRAVSLAASATERWNHIPALACLAFHPAAGKLTICGTDLDRLLSIDCPAECLAEFGSFTLDARQVSALLRGAEAKEIVTIQREPADAAGDVLSIQLGPLTIKRRQLIPIEDWPVMAEMDGEHEAITLPEGALRKVLDTCRHCISSEETRYYLNGVYIHAVEGLLAGVATDGHRLALCSSGHQWPLAAQILPTRAVATLGALLTVGGSNPISVTGWTKPRMKFAGEGWSLTVKTIDGTFPDYDRVIPKPNGDNYKGRAVLAPALFRRIPPGITSERHAAARLDLAERKLSISAPSDGLDASLPIEAEGDIAIGFNMRYLREFAQNHGTIRLQINGSGDAALIHSEDPEFLGVIMPMRV